VNNARNFIVAVASCSYPLCPLLPPTLKSGGARAPPEYMASAPMLVNGEYLQLNERNVSIAECRGVLTCDVSVADGE